MGDTGCKSAANSLENASIPQPGEIKIGPHPNLTPFCLRIDLEAGGVLCVSCSLLLYLCKLNFRFLEMTLDSTLSRLILLLVLMSIVAETQTRAIGSELLNLGTGGNAASWTVTGAGAVNAPAFQLSADSSPNNISLISDGQATGTAAAGGSLGAFDGFFSAENVFFIPTGATDVRLDFDGLFGNDRVVLQLNGIDIGNSTYFGTTGTGLMQFQYNTPDFVYEFDETSSDTVTSGFNIGGFNSLRLIVNNHGFIPIDVPTQTFSFPGDAVAARVGATVTYTAVPEPSSILALVIGAVGIGSRRRKSVRRRNI